VRLRTKRAREFSALALRVVADRIDHGESSAALLRLG
jgi:hypothetical protein